MPIRFSCQQCGQRLRVASRKAGQEVPCPKCQHPITIPQEETADPVTPPTPPDASAALPPQTSPAGNQPLAEFVVYDDDVEWVYESDESEDAAAEPHIALDRVTIPRSVVYMQGILLSAVALIAFIFGVLVAGQGPQQTDDPRASRPCVIEGRVEYASNGDRSRPDGGSIVLVVPADHRPGSNERASIEGLRPQDPVPNDTNAGLRTVRAMGGSYTRTDEQGDYRLRVPDTGTYFVLVVSANAYRDDNDDLNKTDLAQIGRYVLPATDLLGDHAYAWKSVAIRRDRTHDHRF